MWIVENKHSGNRPFDQMFYTEGSARGWIDRMGEVISKDWKAVFESGNPTLNRMINEGLEKRDLEGIILSRVSVDEYLPADQDSDNIVIAFFLKGVPEAVIPFKNFCEKCNGVMDVDYGDSDTIVNTSVVYVEFDRESMDMQDLADLMTQVSMLSGLDINDITLTFPHTNKKFPYHPGLVKHYFDSRTERDNKIAQKKAMKKAERAEDERLDQIKDIRDQQEEEPEQGDQPEQASESMVDVLVDRMLAD